MKRVIALVLIAAALFAVPAAASIDEWKKAVELNGQSVGNRYNLGLAYYNEGMYDDAISALKQAIETKRDDKENHAQVDHKAYKIIGICYYNKREGAPALENFKKSIELSPDDPEGYYFAGISSLMSGNADAALKYFNDALAKGYDDTTELNFRIGSIYYDKKEYATALGYLEKVAARKTDHVDALQYLGAIYNENGNSAKAIDALKKVVKAKPDFDAYFMLGLNYYKQKQYDDMIEAYKKAIELDATKPEAHYNLGMAFYYRNMFEDAITEFEKAKELNPGDSSVYALLAQTKGAAYDYHLSKGTTYLTEQEFIKAKKEFELAKAAKPDGGEADRYLNTVKETLKTEVPKKLEKAKKYYEASNYAGAFNEWDGVVQADPENNEAREGLAKIQGKINDIVKARNKNAEAAIAKGDYAAAMEEYNEILKIVRKSDRPVYEEKRSAVRSKLKTRIAALLKDANLYLTPEKKNYKKALQKFNEALKYDENNEKALDGITKVNSIMDTDKKKYLEIARKNKSGDKEKALNYYKKVLNIDPNNEEANNGVRDLTGKESKVAVNAKEVRSLYYEGVDKFINGDIETAASLWKKVLAMDPGHVEAKKNLERANDMLKALQKR